MSKQEEVVPPERMTKEQRQQLRGLLDILGGDIAVQRRAASYYENWNFYNHLEALQIKVSSLTGELNSKMLDAEAWRAY